MSLLPRKEETLLYISHIFHLRMVQPPARIFSIDQITEELARSFLLRDEGFVSCFGNKKKAPIVEKRTGISIEYRRAELVLKDNDILIVPDFHLPEENILKDPERLAQLKITWWAIGPYMVKNFQRK
jgi:hypothetical protein